MFKCMCVPEGNRRHYKKQWLVWLSDTVQVVPPLPQSYLHVVVRWVVDTSGVCVVLYAPSSIYTKCYIHQVLYAQKAISGSHPEQSRQKG